MVGRKKTRKREKPGRPPELEGIEILLGEDYKKEYPLLLGKLDTLSLLILGIIKKFQQRPKRPYAKFGEIYGELLKLGIKRSRKSIHLRLKKLKNNKLIIVEKSRYTIPSFVFESLMEILTSINLLCISGSPLEHRISLSCRIGLPSTHLNSKIITYISSYLLKNGFEFYSDGQFRDGFFYESEKIDKQIKEYPKGIAMTFKPIAPLCESLVAIIREDSYNKKRNVKIETEPQTIIYVDVHVTRYSFLTQYIEQLSERKEKNKFNLLNEYTKAIAYFLLFYTLNIIGLLLGYPEIIEISENKYRMY